MILTASISNLSGPANLVVLGMRTLASLDKAKLEQWAIESAVLSSRAMAQGVPTTIVTYPTGLQMVRFTLQCGTTREVKLAIWELVQKDGGKVIM